MKRAVFILMLFFYSSAVFGAEEVTDLTHTKVVTRAHPKTGKPYVSILDAADFSEQKPLGEIKYVPRPDYRMLDPKMKSGEIPYEGPSSDRKKVYIFAASLAVLGTVSGAAVIAAAPAATGTSAAGGAGAYGIAGGAVAAGTLSAGLQASKPRPDRDDFKHLWEAKALPLSPNEGSLSADKAS